MPLLYLLHAQQPIPGSRCQHYFGYTGSESLKKRIQRHREGDGARIPAEWKRHGIDFVVARTWNKDPWTGGNVTRSTEARFKNRSERWQQVLNPATGEMERVRVKRPSLNPKRMCPICHPGNERGMGRPPQYIQTRKEVTVPDDFEYDDIPF